VIPLKDNVTTGALPVVTILLIVLNLLVLGWQLTLSGDDSSSTALAVEHVSKRDQAAIELGAIPFRLTRPGSECGVGSEGIVCGENGLVEAGGTLGTTVPDDIAQPPFWVTPLTSMFLHADLLHVTINMLFLWIFGGAVEAMLGRGRFLALYLAAGYAAAYTQSLLDPGATGPLIGAAGAVGGVLGAYAMLRPHGRVVSLSLVPFFAGMVECPALILITAWFGLQLIPGVGNLASTDIASGGTAYFAHVGGFLFGLTTARLLARGHEARAPDAPDIIRAG
jgi:membrane associated rhomboid family serine protease